jgi:hypothetical protein
MPAGEVTPVVPELAPSVGAGAPVVGREPGGCGLTSESLDCAIAPNEPATINASAVAPIFRDVITVSSLVHISSAGNGPRNRKVPLER